VWKCTIIIIIIIIMTMMVVMMWTLTGVGKFLMKSAQNYYIKGSRLNCNGFRIKVKKTGDTPNNVRCETRRAFSNKKREYMKQKINLHETNGKNKDKGLIQKHKEI